MTQVSRVSTVKFIQKGETGKPGPLMYPAGAWNRNGTYTRTADTCPFVLYDTGEEDDIYYYLAKEGEFTGDTNPEPLKDSQNNGRNATWIPIEPYDAIYTKIIMADQAILAGAVAHDNKLKSQYDEDGKHYSEFTGSDFNDFNSNLTLDWINGKLECKDAKITGEIHANSGSFKGEIHAESGSFQTTSATNKARIVIDASKQSISLINKNNKVCGKWHFEEYPGNSQNDYSMIQLSGNADKQEREVLITPSYLAIYRYVNNKRTVIAYISQDTINFNPTYFPTKADVGNLQKGDFYRDGEFVKIKIS